MAVIECVENFKVGDAVKMHSYRVSEKHPCRGVVGTVLDVRVGTNKQYTSVQWPSGKVGIHRTENLVLTTPRCVPGPVTMSEADVAQMGKNIQSMLNKTTKSEDESMKLYNVVKVYQDAQTEGGFDISTRYVVADTDENAKIKSGFLNGADKLEVEKLTIRALVVLESVNEVKEKS